MPIFPDRLHDRYRQFRFHHYAAARDYYGHLGQTQQKPEIMVISCCDSRVHPETIFNAIPGELFVVRNVANLVPPHETDGKYHGVSAALEFAVLNLHIKHIIVMGHSACGGIEACLHHHLAKQSDARFITNWMSMLDNAAQQVKLRCQDSAQANAAYELEREGIKASLTNLKSFPYIQANIEGGSLQIHGTHFDITTGILSVYDEKSGSFLPLS